MSRAKTVLRVAVVGDNTIDRYIGETNIDYVGGNAVNVAVQLRSRGDGIAYFGAVGPGDDGAMIERALRRASLDLSGLVQLEGETAVTRIRLTATGERVFESEDFGVTAEYFPDAPTIRLLTSACWVHLGMLPRAAELVETLSRADPSLPISQDCSTSPGYRGLSVAFDSAGEDRALAEELACAATSGGAALAVITLGALGAIAFDGTRWWEQDPHEVHVIDTTGAGDSFAAGFIEARLQGASIQDALAGGASWAAATCAHLAGFRQ